MSVYKRGEKWWFKFRFEGQVIRESAHTSSKNIAREAERARRRDLELGVNRIAKRERMPLFSIAAREWLESKAALTPLGRAYYSQYVGKLSRHFGARLVSDITLEDIAALQRKRQGGGLSARTINCEVATLRQVLKHFGLWLPIAGRVRFLRERTDTGRALSAEDERKLLHAIGQSRSPALYPMFVLSLDAGLRPSEIRSLRRRDLGVKFEGGVIAAGEIIVGQSKTEAGAGRIVPLTRRACAALTLWLARFSEAGPDSYVFPLHHVGFNGNGRAPHLWGLDLNRPMMHYKRAWETARRKAGVTYRLYDARHTFVTRLAENPAVSEETIRQLAGHVSVKMLSRYSHIRVQAKRAAIAMLERSAESDAAADFGRDGAQNWAQSADLARPVLN